MELILGASLIAAFVAGVAALFAPCCVTVLLPAYFASIFQEKRKVFLMTFIFFLGILTVFLPLGLGFSVLGQVFASYHRTIFIVAGVFFLILGALLVAGKRMSLPFKGHPSLAKHNVWGIYVLGIFSGVATTCCAPVLAGVFALSILPGSLIWGGIYTLAYVLGMVLPLFILAAFLDKANFTKRLMKTGAMVRLPWSEVTIPELISGVTFLIMGALTLFAAARNTLATHAGGYQLSINIYLAQLQAGILKFAGVIPGIAWAAVVLGIVVAITLFALKQRRNLETPEEIPAEKINEVETKSTNNKPCCHEKD
jgi:cytochrome c biogenesis protein CcdA